MEVVFLISFFALGAIMASFIGVVAGRLSTGESIVSGRSRCDACGAPLHPLALVPIFSYLLSRGRARCCGSAISMSGPVSEAVLGTLFVASYLKLGFAPTLPLLLIALMALLALVLYDLSHQILPPSFLAVFAVASGLFGFYSATSTVAFLGVFWVALVLGGILVIIHVVSRGRAMGLADAPLAFALALLTGELAFSGFVYSFWIGAVIGTALLARRPAGSRMGVEVPFAPFLAAGFLLAYFTQWNIISLLSLIIR